VVGHGIASSDLIIARASVTGPGARKVDLRRSLAGLHMADVTIGDEILLIPQMRSRTRLSPSLPASHFAAGLTEELRQIRREALVDPAHGVPEGRAVRFSSHDRYAAWLIVNWLQPASLQTRDLVVELLKGQSVEQWQRRVILHDGVRIVRLTRALAVQGQAVAWVGRLSPGDCTTVIQSLGRTYGFGPAPYQAPPADYARTPVSVATRRQEPHMALPVSGRTGALVEQALRLNVRQLAKSVALQLTEPLSELSEERQAILLAALVLAEQPGIGDSLTDDGWQSLARMAADLPEAPDRRAAPTTAPRLPETGAARRTATTGKKLADYPKAEGAADTPNMAAPRAPERTPLVAHARVAAASAISTNPRATAESHSLWSAAMPQFHTRFGGLMFVINILLALELYPDFTAPLGRRLKPSPFWLLAELGVQFFGRSFRRDPLFRLLHNNGQAGRLPDTWQIDPDWLARFPQKIVLRSHFDGQSIVQRDVRGFVYSAQTAKPYSRKAIASRPEGGHHAARKLPAERDARWIACLAAFIRFRIVQAAPELDIKALRMPATVCLTDDSVEMQFALATLPLGIRMAGLDRNPGWLPSEGRSIAFQFS
jgi:hypothetical protein